MFIPTLAPRTTASFPGRWVARTTLVESIRSLGRCEEEAAFKSRWRPSQGMRLITSQSITGRYGGYQTAILGLDWLRDRQVGGNHLNDADIVLLAS